MPDASHRTEALARELAQAWRHGTTLPLPASGRAPASRAEAYAVQDRMAELIGGRIAGWKVGATLPAVQRMEGHDGPVPGRLFADRVFRSPARIPAAALPNLRIECEFAFRLLRLPDEPAGRFSAGGLRGVVDFHPAIEVASSRWATPSGQRAAGTFDGIADNGSGGAAVLGPAVPFDAATDFAAMPIAARIDGGPPLAAYAGEFRGDPLVILAETMNALHDRGQPLHPGQIVLTGSLTLPTPMRAGQSLAVRFGAIAALSLTLV